MGILKKIAKSAESFNEANRFPPNVLVLNPATARSAIIEANGLKGALIKNKDGSNFIKGMFLIENSKMKVDDVLVLEDSVELDNSIQQFYSKKY